MDGPEVLPMWFGPKGFSCQTKEIDLQPGGVWILDMIGPDGTVYPNRHRIVAHDRPHRIEYLLDGGGGPHDDAPIEVVVTMEAVPEGTRLTLHMTFPTAAHRNGAAEFGAEELGHETLEKLANVVESGGQNVINWRDAEEHESLDGDDYGGSYRILTPSMDERGRLGVNMSHLPPGRTGCPFHTHAIDDEVFYIISGSGVLRYGDSVTRVTEGDCISCPAGTGIAHQLYNDGEVDMVYLGIGANSPHEVCTYPDSGKVLVRSLGLVGKLTKTDYMADEPRPAKIRGLAEQLSQ